MAKKPDSNIVKPDHAQPDLGPGYGPMYNHAVGTISSGIYNSNSHPLTDYISTSRMLDPTTPFAQQVRDQCGWGGGIGDRGRISFPALTSDPRKPSGELETAATTAITPRLGRPQKGSR